MRAMSLGNLPATMIELFDCHYVVMAFIRRKVRVTKFCWLKSQALCLV